jgi:membrane-associated phospholipid phosphatase
MDKAMHGSGFWVALSAFGESRLLLPAALIAMLFVAMSERPPVIRWLWTFGVACALVLASKLAFLGWGVGWAAIDFTGFSGHSMVSAAVYPVLGYAVGNRHSRRTAWALAAVGALLALLIGISRLVLQAHSVSEVVLGLLIGGVVSGLVLASWPAGRAGVRVGAVALGFVVSAMASYSVAPQLRTHDVVVSLALALSGADAPYTREALHRRGS